MLSPRLLPPGLRGLALPLLAALLLATAATAVRPAPAGAAADVPVNLTLDGRPISNKPDVAVMHDGVMFVDAVDFTKVFNGLLVFSGKEGVKIAVRGHSATFHAGERHATIDGKTVQLQAAPFVRGGDIYIPIKTILAPRTAITMRETGPNEADLHLAVFSTHMSAQTGSHASPAKALSLVQSANAASDGLHVAVKVTNTLSVPYTLNFSSGARATFLIDRDGASVWDSSQGQRYTQSLSHVTLAPGEAVTYTAVWTAWSTQPAGRYQLRTRLMLVPPLVSSPSSLGVVTPGSSAQ